MSPENIAAAKRQLPILFPQLQNFQITSGEDSTYNCLAWAAEDTTRWWDHLNFWPRTVPREWTLAAYVSVYESLGYEQCNSAVLETGFVKLAIFVDRSGLPTHISRQLPDGLWTSKLGAMWDITHQLEELGGFEGQGYGLLAVILRRAVKLPAS